MRNIETAFDDNDVDDDDDVMFNTIMITQLKGVRQKERQN